jgi:hypothetical protein
MNKKLLQLTSSVVFALGLICFLPAQAGFQPYNWVVTIDTEEIPGQFQYAGSTLRPLVLARVSYARTDGSDAEPYENLWFCDGKPFGLERFNNLNVGKGQGVALRITHKSIVPQPWENKAAAKSIVRLLLDVRINNSMLQTVILPDDSFIGILAELQNDHFSSFSIPLERPYQLSALMYVTDESKNQNRTLCYAPNSAGTVGD